MMTLMETSIISRHSVSSEKLICFDSSRALRGMPSKKCFSSSQSVSAEKDGLLLMRPCSTVQTLSEGLDPSIAEEASW
jgi:hypothetical protein